MLFLETMSLFSVISSRNLTRASQSVCLNGCAGQGHALPHVGGWEGQASCRDESLVSVHLAWCPCSQSTQCPQATTTHTKSAPCVTPQMKDQTSAFTIGSLSKLLITENLMCSSCEKIPGDLSHVRVSLKFKKIPHYRGCFGYKKNDWTHLL